MAIANKRARRRPKKDHADYGDCKWTRAKKTEEKPWWWSGLQINVREEDGRKNMVMIGIANKRARRNFAINAHKNNADDGDDPFRILFSILHT